MAKLTGPLLSFEAQGAFSRQHVFKRQDGRNIATTYPSTVNLESNLSNRQQDIYSILTRIWERLGAINRIPWEDYSRNKKFSAYNAFMKANLHSLHNGADMQALRTSIQSRGAWPSFSNTITVRSSSRIDVTVQTPQWPQGWDVAVAIAARIENTVPENSKSNTFTSIIAGVSSEEQSLILPLLSLKPSTEYAIFSWIIWRNLERQITAGVDNTFDIATTNP